MSWLDTIQTELTITTGDGLLFAPLWKNTCAKNIEYNIAQFDFPKIAGSKIDRGTPMARQFSLEIYFQGDNNLTQALAFETSAADPRPWKISHPIYGSILVQPISLKFDYSGYNATQITGTLLETLGDAGPRIVVVPRDRIIALKSALDIKLTGSYVTTVTKPSIKDVVTLNAVNQTLYDIGKVAIKLTEDAGKFFNLFNSATAAINLLISDVSGAITTLQAVINFPSQIVNTIKTRMQILASQFESLGANLSGIIRPADKINYETTAGTLVSSLASTAVTSYDSDNNPVTSGLLPDYKTKADVLAAIATLQATYDAYLAALDQLQTANGGNEDSFIPDAESSNALNELINYTISNLYSIALNAKQERIVVLEADSNLIILAHRFYGLLADDSTIDTLMENNNICLNDILQVKKGTTLTFYI